MSSLTKQAASFPKLHACWLQAPAENAPGFGAAYKSISIAVQAALRKHLAVLYFADLKRFRDLQTAFPMLAYRVSRPYRAKTRSDLTYDVLNPRMLTKLIRMSRKPLINELARVQSRLHAEHLPELAAKYDPKQIAEIMKSVKRLRRSRKCINLLIRGEGVLVDALVEIGGMAGLPPRKRGSKLALLAKKWDLQLRRLYPGRSFQGLAPVLLDAATKALRSFLRTQPVIAGGHSHGGPAKTRGVKLQLRRL